MVLPRKLERTTRLCGHRARDREEVVSNHTSGSADRNSGRYVYPEGSGWSYHAPFAGHDGIQLAIGQAFRWNKDFLFPYYRDLLTVLSAGMTPYEIILNGLSKDGDVAGGGRHMSNHFAKPDVRIQNVSSCTGNHTLHAVGVARAIKFYGGDEIAISSQGEASTSEGYVYEALNGASREKLPVIFVVQNNRFGISVPVSQQSANPRVSDNYRGLKNLKIINVDGTDFTDCHNGMQAAIEYIQSGKGPVLLHAQCERLGAHSILIGTNCIEPMKKSRLLRNSIHWPSFAAIFWTRVFRLKKNSLKSRSRIGRFWMMLSLKQKTLWTLTRRPWKHFCGLSPSPVWRAKHRPTVINGSCERASTRRFTRSFTRNSDTFLWGQDVASKDKGGVFNVTKGMESAFGSGRVFNGPIAEDYIVGTANGMSRYSDDIRIVIEAAQFADYVWPAMEQIVEMTHEYWRTRRPLVPM